MQQIKVQAPAKINLTLEVLNKREDGFHNIQSIMHAISLSDFLTIKLSESVVLDNEIVLSGTSPEIPYDERNLVHKAIKLYFENTNTKNTKAEVFIEKNIPVAAGLAGGSTDAAAALFGINELLDRKLEKKELHKLAATLGSDLNFCLDGGCALCTGRGEIIEKLPPTNFSLSLIKPKNLGISAKEAYQKFAVLKDKSHPDNTTKLKTLLLNGKFDKTLIYNSLEKSILPDYPMLRELKSKICGSLMSGSGPTFYVLNDTISGFDCTDFEIFNGLTAVNFGVKKV